MGTREGIQGKIKQLDDCLRDVGYELGVLQGDIESNLKDLVAINDMVFDLEELLDDIDIDFKLTGIEDRLVGYATMDVRNDNPEEDGDKHTYE